MAQKRALHNALCVRDTHPRAHEVEVLEELAHLRSGTKKKRRREARK